MHLALQQVTLERYTASLDTAYILLLTSLNFVAVIFYRSNNVFPGLNPEYADSLVVGIAELFIFQVLTQARAMITHSYSLRWEAWKVLFINFPMIFIILPVMFRVGKVPLPFPDLLASASFFIAISLFFFALFISTLTSVWISNWLYRNFEKAVRQTKPEISPFFTPLMKGTAQQILAYSVLFSVLVAVVFQITILLPAPYGLVAPSIFAVTLFLVIFGRVIARKSLTWMFHRKS